MIYPIGVACFLFGVVAGLYLHYLTEYKPLARKYYALVETVVGMKKQGFVPQFEIEQPKPIDLTKGMSER
jgi:hypothetical protein